MLGHRGCRLGISYPEIYEMQCRAIFRSSYQILKKNKQKSAFPRNNDTARLYRGRDKDNERT